MDKTRNIILVGFMGAGKTTVGKALAKNLGWRFFDSDIEIEKKTGVSVATIFEIEGEAGFRRREAEMLENLCELEHVVLATGGGVVTNPTNRERLKAAGNVIYLRARPEHLYARVRHDKARPLLRVENPLQKIRELLGERDAYYLAVSDLVIDVDLQSVKVTVQQICGKLNCHENDSCSDRR